MPYAMFHQYFPEIAKVETRNIAISGEANIGLPAGNYAFLEMFCNESGCDCRRVFFWVLSERSRNCVAVIAYGWESPSFYAKWMKDTDPFTISELKGPVLNAGSPQSDLAPALLDIVRNLLLQDRAYMDRIKRHYSMFRAKIDGTGRGRRTPGSSNKRKKMK